MLKVKTDLINNSNTATYYKIRDEINKEYQEEMLPPRYKVRLKYENGELIIENR